MTRATLEGLCPLCGRFVKLKVDGTFRTHRTMKLGRTWCPAQSVGSKPVAVVPVDGFTEEDLGPELVPPAMVGKPMTLDQGKALADFLDMFPNRKYPGMLITARLANEAIDWWNGRVR